MGFVKTLKTKAYFKRYQTKFRRRREGKTDYRQRRKLVTQDCNKYSTPKYRFVVRISNLKVTCQIIQAKMQGDEVLSVAYSSELPRYGIKCGLTNYAGCYATGLLLARRHLAKIGLADDYQGQEDVSSDDFEGLFKIEQEGENRPFKALMDVGIANTSTGARPFAAMKGAIDGGIDIPHSHHRFVGWSTESSKKGGELDTDVLRDHILGKHVAEYMEELLDDDEDQYKSQFARYIAADLEADDIVDMYKEAHEYIRKDPSWKNPGKQPRHAARNGGTKGADGAYRNPGVHKLNNAQRKDRVRQKLASLKKAAE